MRMVTAVTGAHELAGIRRDRPGAEDPQAGLPELLEHIGDLHPANEDVGQPNRALEAHVVEQPRPPQVTLDDTDPLPGGGDGPGEVGRRRRLALTGHGGREDDGAGSFAASTNLSLVRSEQNASARGEWGSLWAMSGCLDAPVS